MELTKTQIRIMTVFASKITEKFSALQISKLIRKQYPVVHRSVKALVQNGLISKDARGFLCLNYKNTHSVIGYIESLRAEQFLEKNKMIALFAKDVLDEMKSDFFVLLVFGSSAAEKRNSRDVDILLIMPSRTNNLDEVEKQLERIASNFTVNIDCNAVSAESAREMLSKRDEPNVMNETLNNHILVFGAESYHRLLKYAR